jgi:hypothetical protein
MKDWSLKVDANDDQRLTAGTDASSLARETTEESPGSFDVLLGRGKTHTGHPGNKRLQTVLSMHSVRYNATTSRKEKTAITQEIVQIIHSESDPPGRFLKFDKDANGWVKVDDAWARIKVSHAIRYASRYKKRKSPLANSEPSSQDANTTGSDTSRHREARHQERPRDASPLVFDASILAGLGHDIHFPNDTNDDDDDTSVLYHQSHHTNEEPVPP